MASARAGPSKPLSLSENMKKYLIIPFFMALLALSGSAHAAKFMFGTQEDIHFLAPTKIEGPSGKTLYLGHMVATKSFLLPYMVESRGYVLGINGDKRSYMAMPSDPEVKSLQATGLLPTPLPELKLSWFEYLFGYSLWIVIAVMVLITIAKNLLEKKAEERADEA